MIQLIIRRAYDDAVLSFKERVGIIPTDDFDYLDEDEIKNINKKAFEINIIVFAILSLAIDIDEGKRNKYLDTFNKFIGVKLDELSKEDEYAEIFYTDEFELFSEMLSRINFYKKEIKKLIDNKIYAPPFGIYYYFFLNPGNYSPYAEYTGLEESEIQYAIKDGDFALEIEMMSSIKEIYRLFLNQII